MFFEHSRISLINLCLLVTLWEPPVLDTDNVNGVQGYFNAPLKSINLLNLIPCANNVPRIFLLNSISFYTFLMRTVTFWEESLRKLRYSVKQIPLTFRSSSEILSLIPIPRLKLFRISFSKSGSNGFKNSSKTWLMLLTKCSDSMKCLAQFIPGRLVSVSNCCIQRLLSLI